MGGSAPKFPSANTISGFSANLANTFNLPCPAQGSPIPSFRFVRLLYSQPFEWGTRFKFSLQHLLFATQEPPASLSLKFYLENVLEDSTVSTHSLLYSARVHQSICQFISVTLSCIIEPVGGSTPKFSGKLTSSSLKEAANRPFSLSCPAQGSPVPSYRYNLNKHSLHAEPVGGSAPKFSSSQTSAGFTTRLQSTFSLSCPSQRSPIPSYR